MAMKDAAIASLIAAAVALAVNLVRPGSIPFVAEEEYEILVPCPEPGGNVTPMNATGHLVHAQDTFFVDARSKEEFESWRFREAINLTYDYLDPTPEKRIRELAQAIAQSRSQKVVVYGDGDIPDTGEQLGKEISGHGIKNVFYLQGGAPALMAIQAPGGEE